MNLWRPDRPTQAAMELLTPDMMAALRALAPRPRSSKVGRVLLVAALLVAGALVSDSSSREFFAAKSVELAARVRASASAKATPEAAGEAAMPAAAVAAAPAAEPAAAVAPVEAAIVIPVVEVRDEGAASEEPASAPSVVRPARSRRPAKGAARAAHGKR